MNERIKELYEQAHDEKPFVTLDPATFEQIHHDEMIRLFNPEKFAELIVRECARCVTQPTIQAAGQTEFSMKALQDVLANDMKAYFGVTNV